MSEETEDAGDKVGRRSQALDRALAGVAAGTWDGTAEILEVIAYESKHVHAWRPVRAAALAAMRDLVEPEGEGIMSPEEFARWRSEAKVLARARGDGNIHDRMGISPWTARQYEQKGAPKLIALACAHYLLGRPLPIPSGDSRALEDWFTPRFGGVQRVADWLGVSRDWLTARLKGWEMVKGERVERYPEANLIRALDWMYNVGPICPYGARREALAIWPGQDLDEGY
jgi:hypothetical protein